MKSQWVRAFLLLWLLPGLHSCCIETPMKDPKVETPYGYDLLRHRDLNIDSYDFNIRITYCRNDSGNFIHPDVDYNLIVVTDTSTILRNCLQDFIQGIDFSKESLVKANLGGVSNVTTYKMEWKTFINHKKKEILVKSDVTGSGQCAGCCQTSVSFDKVFVIPKIPMGYVVRVEPDHFR